ncbi:MAG: hypothetical protein H7A45_09030 [Verrucomicrobiales bacterium]|nr:hypothetical protein [Verrucomicrobiales bacterium]
MPDASQLGGRIRAHAMATLHNLVLGLFELLKHCGKTRVRTFDGWRRKPTESQKTGLLTRNE